MKILFLEDNFPPENLGGAGVVAYEQAKGLKNAGHEVYVITAVRDVSKTGWVDYHGLKVFNIYASYPERWRAYLSLYNPQTIGQVKALMEQIQPDITHFHNIHYYISYYCLKMAKKYSRKVFITFYDVMAFHYGKLVNQTPYDYRISPWRQLKQYRFRYNPFRNIAIKHYLKYADGMFADGQMLCDALAENGIKGVRAVYNGIDVNDWQVSEGDLINFKKKYDLMDKQVVYYGARLSDLKGAKTVIDAMRWVVEKNPKAVLLMGGGKQDEYARRLLSLAKEWQIPITLLDWMQRNELKYPYRASNVVLVPSIYFDPIPVVNFEAMACQRPVIGTSFGATMEVVQDGVTGYIVNPKNSKLMAEKISDLLDNPQKAEQFGQAGYERVKNIFSISKQINIILESYEKA